MNIKKITLIIPVALILVFTLHLQPLNHIKSYANDVKVCALKSEEDDEVYEVDNNQGIETYSETEYVSFMEAYFRNLKHNFGDNIKGSCGYVALGMLLSYYDTYLNDNVIPEKYDVISTGKGTNMNSRKSSPGVLFDAVLPDDYAMYDVLSAKSLSPEEYYSIMEKKANDTENPSLHAQLITIGKELDIFNFNGDDEYPFGLDYNKQEDVLIEYLKSENLLDIFKYPFDKKSGESDKLRTEIISNIKNGYPVLVTVYNPKKEEAHACIAYDYDADEDEIYCHMGWKDDVWINYSHYKVSKKFSEFTAYLVLKPKANVTHSHSNNYSVTQDGVTTSYCYCDHRIISYQQRYHLYNERYEEYNNTQHWAYCICGEKALNSHSCIRATKTDTTHTGSCVCGYDMTGSHRWGTIINKGFFQYAVCKDCGYLKDVTNDFVPKYDSIIIKKDEESA